MSRLRSLFAAVLLTVAIAIPAFPGDISCPGVSGTHVHSYSATGEISCPGASLHSRDVVLESATRETTPDATSIDPLTGFFLSLFQDLMSIF